MNVSLSQVDHDIDGAPNECGNTLNVSECGRHTSR